MGPKGWLWDEAGPSSGTVTVCCPSGIPPFHTSRFPLLPSHTTQKKSFRHRLLLQEELKLALLICKALVIPKELEKG